MFRNYIIFSLLRKFRCGRMEWLRGTDLVCGP